MSFLSEAFRCHVHHFQCNPLMAPFINSLVTPPLSCVHIHSLSSDWERRPCLLKYFKFPCACPTVISSIFGKNFHFPFPYFFVHIMCVSHYEFEVPPENSLIKKYICRSLDCASMPSTSIAKTLDTIHQSIWIENRWNIALNNCLQGKKITRINVAIGILKYVKIFSKYNIHYCACAHRYWIIGTSRFQREHKLKKECRKPCKIFPFPLK